jgi:hypothetical protein
MTCAKFVLEVVEKDKRSCNPQNQWNGATSLF